LAAAIVLDLAYETSTAQTDSIGIGIGYRCLYVSCEGRTSRMRRTNREEAEAGSGGLGTFHPN
jgi:hypothetical protein